jgi:farnesyl-diphosphate farnesyltransferase
MSALLFLLPNTVAEIKAMYSIKFGKYATKPVKEKLDFLAGELADMEFCYAALDKVSRSFAIVIRQLPIELRNPVCLFYLTLRGLDTIEDDMQLPLQQKIALLKSFHVDCSNEKLSLKNIGDQEAYQHLVLHYYKVARAFNQLDEKYRVVIKDICQKMGEGMAYYAERKVQSVADYDLYCHYVAGLVGHGLSGLFSASEHEDETLQYELHISNEMGLMLQKTNIIRDYHEDLLEGRIFLPEEIWSEYAPSFDWFAKNPAHENSINCWVAFTNNALQHLPACLSYLQMLKNEQVFRFCAIPQIMAFATLAEIYANPKVLQQNVKISNGQAARYIVETTSMQHVIDAAEKALTQIESKINVAYSNCAETQKIIDEIRQVLYRPKQLNRKITATINEPQPI